MKLRKRVISALMATCMAVTVLPAGMPLKATAAEETTKIVGTSGPEGNGNVEETEMPEIQALSQTPVELAINDKGRGITLADENINKSGAYNDEKAGAEYTKKIIINNGNSLQALVNPENDQQAYVFYDVLDQLSNSIREFVTITWTASSSVIVEADKKTGCLTLTKEGDSTFQYGDKVYLMGEDSANGISQQFDLVIGMQRASNTVKIAGFINKNERKILNKIPADFVKDTYFILYTVYDQEGNLMESSQETSKQLTSMVSDNSLISLNTSSNDIYNINGKVYCSLGIQPGENINTGGETELRIISNKTGMVTRKKLIINADAVTIALYEEDEIKISDVTISDTYYSINGRFPIYIEYVASWGEAGSDERGNLKLVIENDTSTAVAEVESDSSNNYFYVPECKSIHNGDNLELNFSIIYTKNGNNTTLWSGSKNISFTDKYFEVYTDYFPTIGTYYNIDIGFLNADSGDNYISGMYLFDEDNKIVAGTKRKINTINMSKGHRYANIFFLNNPDSLGGMGWVYTSASFYRTRKLKSGEKLYLGCRYNEGEDIKTDKTEMVFVTDQPYITNAEFSFYGDYINLYTGVKNTSFLRVTGYNNIDFSKVSVELRDKDTRELAGKSISYIKENNYYARYCIQWEEGKKPAGSISYNISFQYSDNEINLISKVDSVYYHDNINGEIIWNDKANSVEYYNEKIPAGSLVSYKLMIGSDCISGSGIKVSDRHLLTINLENIAINNKSYCLYVTYTDNNGNETTINTDTYSQDIKKEQQWLYSYGLKDPYYLSNDTSIDFSAWIYCNDESKLLNTCNAKISNDNTGVDTVELSLKKEDNGLFYKGIYKNSLKTGKYHLSFSPDGKTKLGYNFYVCNSDILTVSCQNNNISSGMISMYIPSSRIAEWYCGENNSKIKDKLIMKILDIEKNEIGTYKAANGDFDIRDNTENSYKTIQLAENIKQKFDSIYYCYICLYYDGEEVLNLYDPLKSLYNDSLYNNSYNLINAADYIQINTGEINMAKIIEDYLMPYRYNGLKLYYYLGSSGTISPGSGSVGWGMVGGIPAKITDNLISYGYLGFGFFCHDGFNGVTGTETSFPVNVTITDWYSAIPIKTITIQKPGDTFTETQLKGLSKDKVYNFMLEGADGTASAARGYLYAGNNDSNKPSPTPSSTSGTTGSGGGGSFGGVSSGGGGGTSGGGGAALPTATPSASQTATPVPTAAPTENPTTAPTMQPTAVPEATAAPAATAPPEGANEPEIPINNNPYVPSHEEKPVLKLKKNKITLKKGQKAKIKVTSKLTTGVTYKSLKPSVATVSKKGVITAKKEGKAVITVKANGLVKKVQVTVKKASKTKDKTESTVKTASSVKLNKNFKLAKASITLKKGKKLTIKKASGLSGKVTFRSLDKKIASVSVNGVVKAKKKGKTTILIKKGNKTIKLKITVKK